LHALVIRHKIVAILWWHAASVSYTRVIRVNCRLWRFCSRCLLQT